MTSIQNLALFVFADFLALMAYAFVYSIFLTRKDNGLKILIAMVASSIALLVAYCFYYRTDTSYISLIATILIVSFAYSDRVHIKVLVTFSMLILQYLIEILSLVMISAINDSAYLEFFNNQMSVYALFTISTYIIVLVGFQAIRMRLNQPWKIDLSQLNRLHIVLISILILLVTFYSIFIDQLLNSKASVRLDLPTAFLLSTLLLVVILVLGAGVFLNRLFINKHLETSNKLIEEQLKYQFNHYKQLELNITETRKIKHDMNNHFLCLSHLLLKNDVEASLTYLADIKSAIDKIEYSLDTGNTIVDAIINDKLKRHQKNAIQFSLNGYFPRGEFIPLFDLCSIIANSFDNSLEAVLKLEESSRIIHIETYKKNDYWIYKIRNTCNVESSEDTQMLKTSKSNPELHGFGLMNIQNSVSRCDGQINKYILDGHFHLEIAIPITES